MKPKSFSLLATLMIFALIPCSRAQDTKIYGPNDPGVTQPRLLHSDPPSYSDYGRRNHINGPCMIGLVVDPDGKVSNVHVIRSLEPSLDQEAIKSVQGYRFQPGSKDGEPVAVKLQVEVSFHIYK